MAGPLARDRNGLEILTRTECLHLLEQHHLGRIGLSWDAMPAILPVNYTLSSQEIVIRTAPGTKLSAALAGAVIAFEIDGHEPLDHTGWSVLVRGRTRRLSETAELDDAKVLPLRPWAIDDADDYIALPCELVTGRRIHTF